MSFLGEVSGINVEFPQFCLQLLLLSSHEMCPSELTEGLFHYSMGNNVKGRMITCREVGGAFWSGKKYTVSEGVKALLENNLTYVPFVLELHSRQMQSGAVHVLLSSLLNALDLKISHIFSSSVCLKLYIKSSS